MQVCWLFVAVGMSVFVLLLLSWSTTTAHGDVISNEHRLAAEYEQQTRLEPKAAGAHTNNANSMRNGIELEDLMRFIGSLPEKEQHMRSQNGEDGILLALFDYFGHGSRYYVEFGVEDCTECNTRFLREKYGWSGLLMDGSNNIPAINLHQQFIAPSTICAVFEKHAVPSTLDLLSVDVDNLDYYVLKALLTCGYEPRVLVVEHNSGLGAYRSEVVPDDDETARWDGTDYFGASILAFAKLCNDFGYSLVYSESRGVNLFFVSNSELGVGREGLALVSWVASLFRPPAYEGIKGNKHKADPKMRLYRVV